jgi:tetratricopeptide (TPR) repeat protein
LNKSNHASGIDFYKKNNYRNAIREFSKAITLAPGEAKIYNYRGLAYFNDGQRDKAIADYKKASELEPDNADFKRRLNEALGAAQRRTEEDLKDSVKKVLRERGLIVERIDQHEGRDRVFFFPTANTVEHFPGRSFFCGFAADKDENDECRLNVGLWPGPDRNVEITDVYSMNRTTDIGIINTIIEKNRSSGIHCKSVAIGDKWQTIHGWPAGFTRKQFLDGAITIPYAEKGMRNALDLFLDWEHRVFSEIERGF